ncbi:MAG: rRNA (cytosine1962-C5)-methyltransferase [Desulfonauticus sp.]|jgi:23S rRNA (cytosine1962-C5)-methyltransferase|nr:rRNA (cytosine1962-C5)-methyltransferase [Desulfonauticus sp.]
MFQKVFLKPKEEKRILKGHLWVFSNEIDTQRHSLKSFSPGEIVHIFSSKNDFVGTGFINPNSLICIRILSRKKIKNLEELKEIIKSKIYLALELRENLFSKPYYRLVFGESDYLPGLIIDRFEQTFVLQINSFGMEKITSLILDNILEIFPTASIILKNDSKARKMENLPLEVKVIGAKQETQTVLENDLEFSFPLLKGQKTGWFFDQRENRLLIKTISRGKKVLDIFSYVGSFSLNALAGGAREVVALDRSSEALAYLKLNAQRYGFQVKAIKGEAFNSLQRLASEGEKFDLIILDPPALIPSKPAYKQGVKAYLRYNQLALSLLAKKGFFYTASCSYHLSLEELQKIVKEAAYKVHKKVKILKYCFQGPDHPLHPFMPETLYLKGLFCYVE